MGKLTTQTIEKRHEPATEKVWAKVPKSVRERLEEMAAKEDRTLSKCVFILIEEGFKHRKAA